MTVDEWIHLAGQRDPRPFRCYRDEEGQLVLSDGDLDFALPTPLPGMRMPAGLVWAALEYFGLESLGVDFALDPDD